jgi:hypothetical protein
VLKFLDASLQIHQRMESICATLYVALQTFPIINKKNCNAFPLCNITIVWWLDRLRSQGSCRWCYLSMNGTSVASGRAEKLYAGRAPGVHGPQASARG